MQTKLYLIAIVQNFFTIYGFILLARIVLSWFQSLHHSRIMHILYIYTEPYLGLFRRLIPPLGGLDISPILAFIALRFIEKGFVYLIIYL